VTLLDRLIRRPQPPRTAKAVTALGPWATGVPLSLYDREPQKVAAACLRAYKVGWFYKAGKKIADDVAALDWSISDGDVEEGEGETTLQRPALQLPFDSLSPIDQLQRLLERPNPYQTGRQLLRKTQVRLDFAGAAAWYLEGATSGLPQAIYGISPARMWPSRANDGTLLGWVMDKDQPSGGVPFDASEILWFSTGNADNDDIWGTSVVEAVYSQVPLTDLIARHTGDVLSLGGRLSGMLWPKGRPLTEDEYVEAQRAWRNVASDPNAARRMLIFPEPMEWAQGAATPQEIGIPELASLNRDEILTAFPISPYRLGVPMPGGLNSGELRKEDRKDYWEGSIHPRADLLEETIQVGLVSLYEDAEGRTFDFEIAEPNMDDAAALKDKADAYKELVSIGLDPKESLTAVGLGHIKWLGLPELIDPQAQAQAQQESRDAALAQANSEPASIPAKATKAREDVAALGKTLLGDFLAAQRDRVVSALKEHLPATKAGRIEAIKAPVPDWWDREHEDRELAAVLRVIYQDSSRQGLQVVANALERIVPNRAVARVTADLLTHGTERIADINARTLQAITIELAEGTRRGYSVAQLIDGVPSEGFAGVLAVGMENGVGVWGDARAEMIARTETVLSYNRATLDGYKEFRVVQVEAIDGDGDEECAARNGNVYAVDEALEIEDHPNGTLDWIPVVDKAWHDPAEQVERVLKAMPQPVYYVPPTRTVLDFDDAGKVIGSHEELVHG
jgi:phage portal protein BeeE